MSEKTTAQNAAHLVASMIACGSYDIVRQLIPKTVEDGDGNEHRTFVRASEVIKRVPAILSFEQRFAPLTVNDKTNKFERLHGRDRTYLVPFWYERIATTANNVIKLMAEAKDLEGTVPLVPLYADKRCTEAKDGIVWSVPHCPEKPHVATLQKVAAAAEFVADRAAFLGFRVHSAVKSAYPSQYPARSAMLEADELIEIINNGVTLEEEGDRLEALTETFDHFESFDDHTTLAEAFGSMGNAANIKADNALSLEEYTRIHPVAEAAQAWFSWVLQLPEGREQFAINVQMKILQAKEMSENAKAARENIAYDVEGSEKLDDPSPVDHLTS